MEGHDKKELLIDNKVDDEAGKDKTEDNFQEET